jgi:hypothetical protein
MQLTRPKPQALSMGPLPLPEQRYIKHEKIKLYSEADYYGASYIISSLLGKSRPPRSFCTWKHGWGDCLPLKHPGQLIIDTSLKDQANLVHTQTQAEFLQSAGFHNAYAVGMPFSYAWRFFEGPPRKRGSLLAMPPHMSRYIDIDYHEESYLSAILQVAEDFSEVSVCITTACDEHGRWRSASERLGLNVIVGGNVFDRNSLLRMLSIFSQFDYVTSPSLGSHIVYASLCGCRVSVYGQVSKTAKEAYLKEPYYQRYPEILDLVLSREAEGFREDIISRFRGHPADAKTHIDWAKQQAGIENLRCPGDLARLLGWNLETRIKLIPSTTKRILAKISSRIFT